MPPTKRQTATTSVAILMALMRILAIYFPRCSCSRLVSTHGLAVSINPYQSHTWSISFFEALSTSNRLLEKLRSSLYDDSWPSPRTPPSFSNSTPRSCLIQSTLPKRDPLIAFYLRMHACWAFGPACLMDGCTIFWSRSRVQFRKNKYLLSQPG